MSARSDRDAVLVSLLQPGLARERGGEQIVAEDEIAGRREIENAEQHSDRRDGDGQPRSQDEAADVVPVGDKNAKGLLSGS